MYKSAMAEDTGVVSDLLQRHYPVHWACFQGNEVYLRELLMSGRVDNIYQEDGLHGWTPMHWAAFRGKWKCLELIVECCHIDLDVTNTRFNQTLAHIAAQQSQAEVIAWLRQCGVSLGIQDHMGDTPLHKAAQAGNLECVRLLLSHGAILSTFNQNGHTPSDIAAQNGHVECKALLDQAQCSQHTGFFPSNSSPILMNGEGIYQNGLGGGGEPCQDMEMGEEVGSDGDPAAAAFFQPTGGCKRSYDDEEETPFKRRRLFAPSITEKMGTENNNNVLSSYQGILAMSVEPLKTPTVHHVNDAQEVHAMPTPSPSAGSPTRVAVSGTSSIVDHCYAVYAQANYDTTMLNLLNSDYGY